MNLLYLLAQLSAPVPNAALFLFEDVPVDELEYDEAIVVPFRITVNTDGRIQSCETERDSKKPRVDTYTCDVIRRRARFRPATDITGQPVHGVYRRSIVWWMTQSANSPPRLTAADLHLSLNKLPGGTRAPTTITVMFAVDVSGRPSSCAGETGNDHPALVKVGCNELQKSLKFAPAVSTAGVPVASVQTATIRFSVP